MEIKVLGAGCTNCKKVEQLVINALAELNVDAAVDKVTDFADIASYGVMATPGIVINGQVKWSGGVPSKEKVMALIKDEM